MTTCNNNKAIAGMKKITRHSASAALEMLPDGVLVVRMCGLLTGEALMHFKAEIVARHGPDIRAFVADYTGAAIALTGADLDAVLGGEPNGSALTMPAALIVRPESNGLFKAHALRMAGLHGTTRRVFNCDAQALAWVREAADRLNQ